jgi:hypothetical protein
MKRRIERIEADKGKKGGMRGIEIKVTYNKEFHYPSYVRINHLYYESGDVLRGNPRNTFGLYEFTPLALADIEDFTQSPLRRTKLTKEE